MTTIDKMAQAFQSTKRRNCELARQVLRQVDEEIEEVLRFEMAWRE